MSWRLMPPSITCQKPVPLNHAREAAMFLVPINKQQIKSANGTWKKVL